MERTRVGTAGWTIRKDLKPLFPSLGSQLENYSAQLNTVEINSCFHRDHEDRTYRRWAREVPEGFRFAVKLSKLITHRQSLKSGAKSLTETLKNLMFLEEKLGCVLVQLPPKLEFVAADFLSFGEELRQIYNGPVVLEPRHISWTSSEARFLRRQFQMGRVVADPEVLPMGQSIEDSQGVVYLRLHGSPEMYKSDYAEDRLQTYALKIRGYESLGFRVWCVFDNTTFGHATHNALRLREILNQFRQEEGCKHAEAGFDQANP